MSMRSHEDEEAALPTLTRPDECSRDGVTVCPDPYCAWVDHCQISLKKPVTSTVPKERG